jgi:replicative DNA helicase
MRRASSNSEGPAPPFSMEAEQAALGSMLQSPKEGIAEGANRCEDKFFFIPAHREMFKQLLELWEKDQVFNLISLTH